MFILSYEIECHIIFLHNILLYYIDRCELWGFIREINSGKYQFFPSELLSQNYKCGGYVPCCATVNTHTIVNWKHSVKCYWRLWHITNMISYEDFQFETYRLDVFLASCTLQLWSNLIKISFQGKHFNYFCHCSVVNMKNRISHFQDGRYFQLNPVVWLLIDSYTWNEIYK